MASLRWKPVVCGMIRASLLVDAIASLLFGLLTTFKWPVWSHAMGQAWQFGMVVPEIAFWLASLPISFAIAAVLMRRRGHWAHAAFVVSLSTIALCLFCKPAIQARRLGQMLPRQLGAAFGQPRALPRQAPFSFAGMITHRPREIAIETAEYAPGLSFDFYRPSAHGPAACVINIHGGSWVSGNRLDDATLRDLNDHLAAEGYAVASIDYRLSPQFIWPAQRDDLIEAIAFLRAHAVQLGIDPRRIVLLGRSAGAQIALATAYARPDLNIRGIVDIYGPTDFRLTAKRAARRFNLDHRYNLELFFGGTEQSAPSGYSSASAARLVTSKAPPTLILQGDLDINVFKEQAELLDRKLAAAGVPHALVSLPWGAHAFDLISLKTPGGQIGMYAIDYFLADITR